MDIVTHGMMGVVIASPFLSTAPVEASCFMLGSVAPDLDAFSRVFGKRAFLKAHQTYSHALPIILVIGVLGWVFLKGWSSDLALGPPFLALGMAFHSLLDVTNTYGIMLFAPFSTRRYCLEWVFFIDAVVIGASLLALAVLAITVGAPVEMGWQLAAGYVAFLGSYWLIKIGLRRRALAVSPPQTLSLLPSALVPWHYLGCSRQERGLLTFKANALTGSLSEVRSYPVYDNLPGVDTLPERIPELRVMKALSPASHVVQVKEDASGRRITWRDLRTRNFQTRFGELTLLLDPTGKIDEVSFHV